MAYMYVRPLPPVLFSDRFAAFRCPSFHRDTIPDLPSRLAQELPGSLANEAVIADKTDVHDRRVQRAKQSTR